MLVRDCAIASIGLFKGILAMGDTILNRPSKPVFILILRTNIVHLCFEFAWK